MVFRNIDENRELELSYRHNLYEEAMEVLDDYLLEENDIVFARTGASTGKTYLYNPNDGDLYFAGFLIKFHIKDAVPLFRYRFNVLKNLILIKNKK